MNPPDALLFTLPGCPHCPVVKEALERLRAEGAIGALEVVDASADPARGAVLGVKSVPWYRIGPLEFDGVMPLGVLRQWVARAVSEAGIREYFREMLSRGRRDRVERLIREAPERATLLTALMSDPEASMAVRLGVAAVLEELGHGPLLDAMVPGLARLLAEADARTRADAAHFLSLIGSAAARAALAPYRNDPDPQVAEIVQETLDGVP